MNLFDSLLEKLSASETPNSFTLGMGDLIRHAREEKGLSQRALASKIYRRQAALSEMENGKMEASASTLMALSYHLDKPISYFFPERYKPEIKMNDLSDLEKEILVYSRKLDRNDQIRIIAQMRALSELENDKL